MNDARIEAIKVALDGYLSAMRDGFIGLLSEFEDKPVDPPVALELKDERLFSTSEAAKYLGFSYSYFRRLMAAGEAPPCYDYGRNVKRFKESDLEAWKQAHKKFARKQANT